MSVQARPEETHIALRCSALSSQVDALQAWQQGTKQLAGREDPGDNTVMSAAVASPYFLIAAIILFSLVAYDVRGPGLRLLPQVSFRLAIAAPSA